MRRQERLTKNADFGVVYKEGKSTADRYLVLYVLERPIAVSRLGISISRRVAGSVGRNRLKRLVREAWRQQSHKVRTGYHLVVIVRVAAREANYEQISGSLQKLTKRAGLYKHE